jgi:hypothetical protein
MASGGLIAALFILSLFFSSFFISYFDIGFNGQSQVTPIQLPNSIPSYYTAQNYVTGQYNNSISRVTGIDNSWEFQNNIGMIHTSVSLVPYMNYFIITDLQPSANNNYINTYKINNAIKKPYTIILRYDSDFDENDIYIDNNGFHIPKYTTFFGMADGDIDFIPYPNALNIINPTIITTYHEGNINEDSTATINFNGQSFTFTKLNRMDYVISLIRRDYFYAGIRSNDVGTILVSFNSENVIVNPDTIKNTDALTLVSSLITSMIRLMSYTYPYDIIPLEFQALLIAPQEFMILIGIAIFIRQG